MNCTTLITTTIFAILMVDFNNFYKALDIHTGKNIDVESNNLNTVLEITTNVGTYFTLVVMICQGTRKHIFFTTNKLLFLMVIGGASTAKCVIRMSYFVKIQNVKGVSNIKNLDFTFFYNLWGAINKLYIVIVILYYNARDKDIVAQTESLEEKKIISVQRVTNMMN